METNKIVDRLNSLLRGEISAVETYRMAIDKIQGTQYRSILQDNLRSHERRVNLLQDCVVRYGGKPATGSGVWGALTKVWQGGANVMGDNQAIAALEEGEDQGLKQYRDSNNLVDLDTASLQVINQQVLPEQERTHRALSNLKHAVNP